MDQQRDETADQADMVPVLHDRATVGLLCAFLFVDLVFILSNLLHLASNSSRYVNIDVGFFSHPLMHVGTDNGIPEAFNYLKMAVMVAGLVLLYRMTREGLFLSAACIVGIILCDDSMQIHESFGRLTGALLGNSLPLGLRGQDVGEATVYLTWMVIAYFLIRYGIRHSTSLGVVMAVPFGVAFVLFGFFAGGVDILQPIIMEYSARFGRAAGIAEDAGEMLVMSTALAMTIGLVRQLYGARLRRI